MCIRQVEAYRPNDSACHGRFGMTQRTAPVVRCFVYSLNSLLFIEDAWLVMLSCLEQFWCVFVPIFVVWARWAYICISLLWSPHDAQYCC